VSTDARRAALWLLLGLFVLRVVGQIVVGLLSPAWLPPWREWYSGLLPYPLLLPAQLALIAWMVALNVQNTTGTGRWRVESPRVRRVLRVLAGLYAGAMLLRYVLTMVLVPEMRWLHGTIPIVFHWVLAAYVAVLAASYDDRMT